MPKSKLRKKVKEQQAHEEQVHAVTALPGDSPRWLAPVMIANFLIGLFWIVVYYIATMNGKPYPLDLGNWNMAIGFTFVAIGFSLATKWR
jgi:hypothetical protein